MLTLLLPHSESVLTSPYPWSHRNNTMRSSFWKLTPSSLSYVKKSHQQFQSWESALSAHWEINVTVSYEILRNYPQKETWGPSQSSWSNFHFSPMPRNSCLRCLNLKAAFCPEIIRTVYHALHHRFTFECYYLRVMLWFFIYMLWVFFVCYGYSPYLCHIYRVQNGAPHVLRLLWTKMGTRNLTHIPEKAVHPLSQRTSDALL